MTPYLPKVTQLVSGRPQSLNHYPKLTHTVGPGQGPPCIALDLRMEPDVLCGPLSPSVLGPVFLGGPLPTPGVDTITLSCTQAAVAFIVQEMASLLRPSQLQPPRPPAILGWPRALLPLPYPQGGAGMARTHGFSTASACAPGLVGLEPCGRFQS